MGNAPRGGGGLGRYLLGRALQSALALWVTVSATFAAVHLLPGDPFGDPQLDPAVRRQLAGLYGLGLPLWRQYIRYMSQLVQGHLGWSLHNPDRAVGAVIAAGVPVSAVLGGLALLWAVPIGAALGLVAAQRRNGWLDRSLLVLAVVGLAIPSFVLAVALDDVGAVRLRLLPVAGWGTAAQAILPAVALGLAPLAVIARLVRAQAAEVIDSDYVLGARARGLSWPRLLTRHVLRNALLPAVTALGPLTATVLMGSFVVENIFAVPGLGRDFVAAVLDRDYPLVTGITVFYAALLLVCNFLADVAAVALDPRLCLGPPVDGRTRVIDGR